MRRVTNIVAINLVFPALDMQPAVDGRESKNAVLPPWNDRGRCE